MNAIPANELKRHGISAVEKLLPNGPVHIIKHNQPVCVIIGEDDYRQLTRAAESAKTGESRSVMEWFALYSPGTATKDEIDRRLEDERESWDKK